MPIEILKSFIGENYPNILLTLPAILFIISQIISIISNVETRKKFEEDNHRSIILKTFYTSYYLNFLILSGAYHLIYQLSHKNAESLIMALIVAGAFIFFIISMRDEKIKSSKELEIGILKLIILGAISTIYVYFKYIDQTINFPNSFLIDIFIIFNFLLFLYVCILINKSPKNKIKLIYFLGIYDVICVLEFLMVSSLITYILFNDIFVGINCAILITVVIFLY